MIRPATLAELRTRGSALFAAAAAETGSAGVVQWQHLEALDAVGALLLLAVESDGELVGYCCAAVGPEFWSEQTNCATLSLFVQPAHRGHWGRALLRELARAAAARGAELLRLQVIPGSRLERLARRLGFTPRAVALERSNLHYSAGHAGGSCSDSSGGPRLQRVRGRAPGRRREEGDAAAGAGPEGRRSGGGA